MIISPEKQSYGILNKCMLRSDCMYAQSNTVHTFDNLLETIERAVAILISINAYLYSGNFINIRTVSVATLLIYLYAICKTLQCD